MIISPDETYSTREAATFLRKSERQVLRYLKDGKLQGQRPNGRWQITALALWKYQNIDADMTRVWVQYCVEMAQLDGDKNRVLSDA